MADVKSRRRKRHPSAVASNGDGPSTDSSLTAAKAFSALARRKLLVAVVIVVAVLAGFLVASRQYTVETATAGVLIDTPSSQVVDLGAKGAAAAALPDLPALAARARLLGNLMASGSLKERIAQAAGVRPQSLVVVPPSDAPDIEPQPIAPPQSRDVPDVDATILTLTTDQSLPILRILAQAPEAPTAEALAGSAADELERYIGSLAATEEIPATRRLVVERIGQTASGETTRGPTTFAAVGVAILVVALGLALVASLPRHRDLATGKRPRERRILRRWLTNVQGRPPVPAPEGPPPKRARRKPRRI